MNSISDAVNAIATAARIAITPHVRPDGDAIGSVLGLRRMLTLAGKTADIVAMDPVPLRYQFLMRGDVIVAAAQTKPESYDLLIILDTGSPDRVSASIRDWVPRLRTLNIDHHPTNTEFADINTVVPNASSVGEILWYLAIAGGYVIAPDAAEALWVALITDTGRFSYSNTTPAAMRAAAALLETGIDTNRINHQIYNSATAPQVRLQGRAIEHLELHHDGQLAVVSLSREDFAGLACSGEDAEDIVDIPRRINGVKIALFLYELCDKDPRETKASFRTSEPFDAAAFCQAFRGGGHARAAGCTLAMPIAEARQQMLEAIRGKWFET